MAEIVAVAWALLASRRTLILATVSDGAPSLRMIVPRGVDPAARRVRFYTDARSAKVLEIRRQPRVGLLAWDEVDRVQLRLGGVAAFADAAATDAAWAGQRPGGYLDYATVLPPGAALAGPLERGEPAIARANFLVVDVTIDAIEWLRLDPDGHDRRRAVWAGNGWRETRLVP